jgi:cytosine/adenosine deaminase-related metal-dependent hydrolase
LTSSNDGLGDWRIRELNGDPSRRLLIRGGAVLTMDGELGDFAPGDVLVEGRRIVAVGADLGDAAVDGQAIVLDARDKVVIPGMHDTHRHCWQNQLRRLIPDCDDNLAYLQVTHHWLGLHYRPHDIYVGNLISALGAIDSGVTCVVDLFHNARSSAHSDAAVRAFREAGIRGVHAQCAPFAGAWDEQWPDDLVRMREEHFAASDDLLSLRLGLIGSADFAPAHIALTADRIRLARDLGIGVSTDGVLGPSCSREIESLGRAGLLGPDLTLIHCLDLSDDAWRHMADAGVTVSLPVTSDAQIGISESIPAIQRALDSGIRPSLSVDVEVCLTSDLFTQMRTVLNIQRMLAFNRRYRGEPLVQGIRVRDVLEFATIGGADASGLAHKVGTLTPGKEADVVLIGAHEMNTMPLNNAYGTVVTAADTRNVDAVLIAGEIRKWRGALTDFSAAQVLDLVVASRDHVLEAAGFDLDVLEQRVGFAAAAGDG